MTALITLGFGMLRSARLFPMAVGLMAPSVAAGLSVFQADSESTRPEDSSKETS